jgi:glycosyltransferase involved in cell wall biosynthesis
MVAYTIYDMDNRVMRYAETLAARGDHVDLIALRQPHDGAFKKVVNGVNVYRVQSRVHDEKKLRSYAFRLSFFFLRATWLLSKLHLRRKYDVVHVHSVPDPLVFTAWLPKLMGARIILDIHDLLPELYASKFDKKSNRWMRRILLAVEHASAAFADYVIVANDLWKDRIIARGSVSSDRCAAIMNFPDQTIFKRNGNKPKAETFTIMYPGTLSWHQGLDIAIRAFASIRDKVPEAQFHIYGDGTAKPSLIQLAEDLGIQTQVIFHGLVPLRAIAQTMASADLAVVPKRKDSFGDEAFSTKTFEFMSLGVPLLIADTTIDKYYFSDSVVRFFRSGDQDDMAGSMLELIKTPSARQQLAQNALQFVQHYTWDVHKHRYLQLVDSLARKDGRCYRTSVDCG